MDSSLSDEELVGGILEGDELAFSRLYDRYRGAVYATACRIIQNSDEAQDATQEIFIKLYRSIASWDPGKSKFSIWLYRLASNHAIDCWRSRRRRAESQMSEDSAEKVQHEHTMGDAFMSPFGEVKKKEEVEKIRRCMDLLPDLQKKVFVLRYFQELKLTEIAEMENCSLGTVKSSLFRATQAMRRSLRKSRGL
jgi:RNA polymerase sigma-70 factor (ECF subfamily)